MASDINEKRVETYSFGLDEIFKEAAVVCFLQVPGLSAR